MRGRAWSGLLGAAIVLVAATAGAPALAQASGQGTSQATDAAAVSQLYNQGVDASKAGDWPKAYESFLAAWKIKEHYQIAANLGRAEIKIGKYRDAAEHLSYFLREAKDVKDADREAAQQMLNEAKGHTASIFVKVNRPGAEVLLDGKPVGLAPLSREFYLDPGSHTLEARLGEEKAEPVTVELAAGGSRQVGLTIRAKRAAGETGPEEAGPTAPPGPRAAGGDSEASGSGRKIVIGVGIGLTVLAAGAGAALGTMAIVKKNERDAVCGETCEPGKTSEFNEREREKRSFRSAAIGSLAAAAVLGTGTLVYAVVSSGNQSSPTTPVQAGFMVLPEGASFGLSGAW